MRSARGLRALALVAALTSLATLGACGSPSMSDDAATPSTGAATGAAATDPAADEFLRLSAAHLCTVQGTVYANPADLAAAYEKAPDYPSLSSQQVAAFDKQVLSDPAFSARLLEQVASTCGTTR